MLENTKENKVKFFAQYFGQNVLHIRNSHIPFFIQSMKFNDVSDNDYLGLTDLSNITDEDAIEVARICGKDYFTQIVSKTNGQIVIMPNKKGQNKKFWQAGQSITINVESGAVYYDNGESYEGGNYNYDLGLEAYDFLRSRSYLIPYNGTPTETLIEYGWAVVEKN